MALVNSLCAMLRTTPFHREDYSRLILGVVAQFWQRCNDQFRDVISRETHGAGEPLGALAAQWAHNTDVFACLSGLLEAEVGLHLVLFSCLD